MFHPNPTPLVSTVIDVRLRGLRRGNEDRLFDGWGVSITPNRLL
jgi:hypothetical protein